MKMANGVVMPPKLNVPSHSWRENRTEKAEANKKSNDAKPRLTPRNLRAFIVEPVHTSTIVHLRLEGAGGWVVIRHSRSSANLATKDPVDADCVNGNDWQDDDAAIKEERQ